MNLHLENVSLALTTFELQVNHTLRAPITGLYGPSGAGKTSLLEIIAGLRKPSTGRITFNNTTLADAAKKWHLPPEKRNIGYLPQDLALFPHLTVRDNVCFAHPEREAEADVCRMLEISALLDRRIHHLSGGEQQRVALARALHAKPQLMLLDEPLSKLDHKLKDRLLDYIQTIHAEFHLPMLIVSHAMEDLMSLCGEILTVEGGRYRHDEINGQGAETLI